MRSKYIEKVSTLLFSIILILGLAIADGNYAYGDECSLKIYDLRCEYLNDPLGIDVPKPRLSWRLKAIDKDKRGQHQTAYQIMVASQRSLLSKEKSDLWDSGVVKRARSILIEYGGDPLQSGMYCYWKVRVKDENGIWSDWSRIARWSMGLLKQSDWQAKWIGIDQIFEKQKGWPPPDNTIPDPWFRKTFTLDATPRHAVIYVASIGYHELYVNGKQIGDQVLVPSVATHKERARYLTYEIGNHLKKGKNVIALWVGLGWSIYPNFATESKPQTPMVIAQVDIESSNGESTQIVTDKSWKTHPSPNTLLGVWEFMHFGGEQWDASKEVDDWNTIDYDDSDWNAVTLYNPNITVSAEMVEPNRLISEVEPVSIKKVTDEVYRVDMGVNFSGWIEIDVSGKPGKRIEFQYSEREDQPMTHRLHSAYIIGPTGKGTFRNRFNYMTGRWVQIKGLDEKPELDAIRGFLVRTDYERAGDFHCSNELLNNIYETTMWTYENLSLGGYVVDCPQRERMGYGGDAHATTEMGLNNYRLGAFYTKWSQDWRDVQEETGDLPYTAPTYWGGGGPAWSGFCVTLPWEIYLRYGDARILDVNFNTIQRWLDFLETKAKNNMLQRWGGEWDFLGDWLWPGARGVNGDTRETLFFNNCYWIYNLTTAANIVDILDKPDIANQYRQRAETVRKAVHKEFYKPNEGSYVNGFQAYLAIALLVDLPPEDKRAKVWKRLEKEILEIREGHIHAGITGGAFLFKTLLKYDRLDLIYPMAIKKDYPSWGDMLRQGASTLWESWEGHISLLHSSYLYIGTWFIEGLGGIKGDMNHPGFKHFILKPGYFGNDSLTHVKTSHDSIYGTIKSNWKRNKNEIQYNASIPANTSATVYLAADQVNQITESGKPLKQSEGISDIQAKDGFVIFKAVAGEYQFVIKSE